MGMRTRLIEDEAQENDYEYQDVDKDKDDDDNGDNRCSSFTPCDDI